MCQSLTEKDVERYQPVVIPSLVVPPSKEASMATDITRAEQAMRGGSVRLNSSLGEDKWSPAGFRLPRFAAAG